MLYAPPIDHRPALHNMAVTEATMRDERAADEDRFDVTKRRIPSPLEVGETAYRLRSPLLGTFYPGRIGADGQFVVLEFFPNFVGVGRKMNDAYLDWRNQVHCQFQELYAKRPFELTESEKVTWQLLESQIDVTTYRTTTPLAVRQIGKLAAHVRPLAEMIEWENGRREKVRLDQMPGEFAAYKPGQPFEAIVTRDPVDFRLLKVTHIQRIKALPAMSVDEFDSLIRSVPTANSLPDTNWD